MLKALPPGSNVASMGSPSSARHATRSGVGSPRMDPASRRWIEELHDQGAVRDDAVARLHAHLLRAARFEVARRRRVLPHVRGGDFDDLAQQAADDALVAVLAHLDDFRGESRFTTWAYKFALLEAAVTLRRRAWQGREVPLPEAGEIDRLPGPAPSPQESVEQRELLSALRDAIRTVLTPHQRKVFAALALHGVPIDVLADRLGTTRGALYKTLHDARQKLRSELSRGGFAFPETRAAR